MLCWSGIVKRLGDGECGGCGLLQSQQPHHGGEWRPVVSSAADDPSVSQCQTVVDSTVCGCEIGMLTQLS